MKTLPKKNKKNPCGLMLKMFMAENRDVMSVTEIQEEVLKEFAKIYHQRHSRRWHLHPDFDHGRCDKVSLRELCIGMPEMYLVL